MKNIIVLSCIAFSGILGVSGVAISNLDERAVKVADTGAGPVEYGYNGKTFEDVDEEESLKLENADSSVQSSANQQIYKREADTSLEVADDSEKDENEIEVESKVDVDNNNFAEDGNTEQRKVEDESKDGDSLEEADEDDGQEPESKD